MKLEVLMPSVTQLITKNYRDIKTPETERLIKQSFSGLTPVQHPKFWQVSGIPGSGKSTYCTQNIPINCLFLSFDKIMSSLSGYQQILATSGREAAFQIYEMPARIIGYEILRQAIAKKYNIMFEHSGTNPAHVELLKNLSHFHYQTEVDFIICDINKAISRVSERASKINRYVPTTLVSERAENLKQYITVYKGVSSNVHLLDGENNFSPLKKI
jgi:probable phosphoglycerate mutase